MSHLQKYSIAFALALSLHLSIIGLFAFNFINQPAPEHKVDKKIPEIIEASILDENLVTEKAKQLKQAEANQKQLQQNKKEKLRKQLAKESERLRKVKNKRLHEEKIAKKAAIERKKMAINEQKKLQVIKNKLALEKKKQVEIKKQKIAKEKQQRIAAEKRKLAAEKKEQAHQEAVKQKKIEADKQRIADAKREKIAAEKLVEANRVRAENARIAQKATVAATALIKRKVNQSWNRPTSVTGKLACTIRVGLIPGGDVMSVVVVKGSGNSLFDASAERAVYKASPLPVPKDATAFSQFRSFSFVFSPN